MNPNIAMSFQRPRFNASEGQRNALAIRNAQMQEAANAMQMQQAAMAMQRDAQTRNALAGVDMTTPDGMRQAAGVYGQSGDTDMFLKLNEAIGKMGEQDRTRTLQEMDLFKQMAPGLLSPDTYMQTREALIQSAPSAARWLPEQFDEGILPRIEGLALGIDGVLERDREERRLQLDAVGKTEPYSPAVAAQRKAEKAAGASRMEVNSTSEKEENKAWGKSLVAEYDAVRERADNAAAEMNNLEMLRNIDVQTGAGQELKATLGAWGLALGVPESMLSRMGLDRVSDAQSFIGVAQNLVLTKMQAQKGPQTEGDAKRIEQTVANLGQTPEAKDFLIDAAIALRSREMQQAEFYEQWRADKGSLDGARSAWNDYKKRTPLMGVNPNSSVPVFFNQFREAVAQANPQANDKQILDMWRAKYGN